MLTTDYLPPEYSEYPDQDFILKYNFFQHISMNAFLYHHWCCTKPQMPRLYTLGQIRTIPIYSPKKKMQSGATTAMYMFSTFLTKIMVLNLRTRHYRHIRTQDFHPYHKHNDPTATTTQAFKTRVPLTVKIIILLDTSPPTNLV